VDKLKDVINGDIATAIQNLSPDVLATVFPADAGAVAGAAKGALPGGIGS